MAKVHLYFTRFNDLGADPGIGPFIRSLPPALRAEAQRFDRWQDRARSVFGKILLRKGLEAMGMDGAIIESLTRSGYRRPSISGAPDFNISHSGNCVICAISREARIGVDVEKVRPIDQGAVANTMSRDQRRIICESGDPLKMFFRLWTIKESVIKADGRGVYHALEKLEVTGGAVGLDAGTWYIKELDWGNEYCACLASDKKEMEVEVVCCDLAN